MEEGDLISTGKLSTQALMQSGTILFSAQSPPPITLPALAEAILIFVKEFSKKKDL